MVGEVLGAEEFVGVSVGLEVGGALACGEGTLVGVSEGAPVGPVGFIDGLSVVRSVTMIVGSSVSACLSSKSSIATTK